VNGLCWSTPNPNAVAERIDFARFHRRWVCSAQGMQGRTVQRISTPWDGSPVFPRLPMIFRRRGRHAGLFSPIADSKPRFRGKGAPGTAEVLGFGSRLTEQGTSCVGAGNSGDPEVVFRCGGFFDLPADFIFFFFLLWKGGWFRAVMAYGFAYWDVRETFRKDALGGGGGPGRLWRRRWFEGQRGPAGGGPPAGWARALQ